MNTYAMKLGTQKKSKRNKTPGSENHQQKESEDSNNIRQQGPLMPLLVPYDENEELPGQAKPDPENQTPIAPREDSGNKEGREKEEEPTQNEEQRTDCIGPFPDEVWLHIFSQEIPYGQR